MSDKKQDESFFSNSDTIVRRAWIESAISGVRARLAETTTRPVLTPEDCAAMQDESALANNRELRNRSPQPAETGRPKLYVAWSAGERRSGT